MGAIAGVAVVALLVFASFGTYAVMNDYVPVKMEQYTNMDILFPPGNFVIITENQVFTEYPAVEIIFDAMPHRDDVLYAGFETDAKLDVVFMYYDTIMNARGYERNWEGTMEVTGGYVVTYHGYLKGMTAVGVIATDEHDAYDTLVGYITGNSLHLKEIVEWCDEKVI